MDFHSIWSYSLWSPNSSCTWHWRGYSAAYRQANATPSQWHPEYQSPERTWTFAMRSSTGKQSYSRGFCYAIKICLSFAIIYLFTTPTMTASHARSQHLLLHSRSLDTRLIFWNFPSYNSLSADSTMSVKNRHWCSSTTTLSRPDFPTIHGYFLAWYSSLQVLLHAHKC